ncbi:MAG: AMP-binding protein [Thermoplasmata archaeon]|nr:AMP-binding protein [Thermoplasmata archaeon]
MAYKDYNLTISDLLERDAMVFPTKEAVVLGDRRYSYFDLNEEANRLAAGLLKMGVSRDDKVAIWMHNLYEWVVAWFAVAKIGAVVVPMDTWYKPSEAEYIMGHSEAICVVTSEETEGIDFISMIDAVSPRLPNLEHVIVVGRIPPARKDLTPYQSLLQWGRGWKDSLSFQEAIRVKGVDDVAFILYTSGTTGKPKGAMLTHRNITSNAIEVDLVLRITRDDRILVPVPFSHAFGSILGITLAAVNAATMVPTIGFDPEEALQMIEREGITICHGVPTMFIRLLNVLEHKEYSTVTLRTGIVAGAPCPREVMEDVMDIMGCNLSNAYGETEAGPIVTANRLDDPLEKRLTTVGRPLPGLEAHIVDDDNKPVKQGEVGEIVARGVNIMKGYFKDPDATDTTIDKKGWLHTGDLGMMDKEGFYYIVGRKKDMLIVGGLNVYPPEVEAYFIEHDAILEISIVGIPDKELGEVPVAAIHVTPGESITGQELIDWAYGDIASAKIPRYVAIGHELPYSGRGKVQKFILRDQLGELIEKGKLEKLVPTEVKEKKKKSGKGKGKKK